VSLDKDVLKKLENFKKKMNEEQGQVNRVRGRESQDRAFKMLNVPKREVGNSSQEEFWNSPIRFEVKSGNQVEAVYRQFAKAETQSYDYAVQDDFNKSYEHPFSMIAMPTGTSDGLFICRLSELNQIVDKLIEMWKTNKEGEDNGMD